MEPHGSIKSFVAVFLVCLASLYGQEASVLRDPGSNGILKRTSKGQTAPAQAIDILSIIGNPSASIDTTDASNISSGTLPAARLPNPTSLTLGGIESYQSILHQFLIGISTTGVPSSAQPSCADLTNAASSCSTDTTNASNIASGTLPNSVIPAFTGDVNKGQGSSITTVVAINGTTVPITTAGDTVLGTSSQAQGAWIPIPVCLDSAGQHLNYNTATHTFSCGTSGGTIGSAAWNSLTTGTNSQMSGICTTGCSLTLSGSGVIMANQIPSAASGTTSGAGQMIFDSTGALYHIYSGGADAVVATSNAASLTSGTLAAARLPNPSATTLGGVESLVPTTHQWINTISTGGVPASAQPAFSDLSGSATAAQLPNPTASTLGGVESYAAVTHQFVTSITTSGVPVSVQPAASDITGLAASATTDTTSATNISSGTLPAARLPNPSVSTLGGIESLAAVSHNWISQISTSGVPSATQPAFPDISGSVASTQMPALTGDATTTAGTVATIVAKVNGTSVPTNASADQTIITTASATGEWTSFPGCLDSAGQHLNYNTSTHAFSCGTSGGTAGSAAFNTITAGTNTQAAMTIGAGAYVTPASNSATPASGSVTANFVNTGVGATTASAGQIAFDSTGALYHVFSGGADAVLATTNAASLTSGTLNASRLPGTTVQTGQPNTYTTGLQDLSAATQKLPSAAAAAPTTAGTIQYDTTTNNVFFGNGTQTNKLTWFTGSAPAGISKWSTGGQLGAATAGTDYYAPGGAIAIGDIPSGIAKTGSPNTFTAGNKQTFTANATNAATNLVGVSVDPSGVADGDAWYRSDLSQFRKREGVITVGMVQTPVTQMAMTGLTGTTPGTPSAGSGVLFYPSSGGASYVDSAGTLYKMPISGTPILNNGANAGTSAMTLDMSLAGVAAFKVPAGAGAVASTPGTIVYDSTAGLYHGWFNGADAKFATANASSLTTGTLNPAVIPPAGPTTLGGVQSIASSTHQWINTISSSGIASLSRPGCTDLSDSSSSCSTDTTNAANITSGALPAGRLPAFAGGDCTSVIGTVSLACTKTGGIAFATSATIDTTNAANLTSGTIPAARMPAFSGGCTTSVGSTVINCSYLADSGANGVVKRTALNTTAAATSADVVGLFGAGTCTGFLKSDGTCNTGTQTQTIAGVNSQTVGYTAVQGDTGKFIPVTCTANCNFALPSPSGGNFANGWWIFVQNKGSFNIQLQPAGATTVDGNSFGLLTPGKSAIIQSDGTNYFTVGGARSVVDVTDYGCRGDTLHDDAACINKAITAAAKVPGNGVGNGAIVYFPPGVYSISSPILMPRTTDVPIGGITLVGENKNSTYINALSASWPTAANDILIQRIGYGYAGTTPTCTVTGTGWTVGCQVHIDNGTLDHVYFTNPPSTGYGTGIPTITIGCTGGCSSTVSAVAIAIAPFMVEWDNTHNATGAYISSSTTLTIPHTLGNTLHRAICVNADSSGFIPTDAQGTSSDTLTFSAPGQSGLCYVTNGRSIHEGIRNLGFIEPAVPNTGGIKYRGYVPDVNGNMIFERCQDCEFVSLRMEGSNQYNPVDVLAGGDQNGATIDEIYSDPTQNVTDANNLFDTIAVYFDPGANGATSNEADGLFIGNLRRVYGGFRRPGRSAALWGRVYQSTLNVLNCDGLRGVNPSSYCIGLINGGKNVITGISNEGLAELAQIHFEHEVGDTLIQPNIATPNGFNGHPAGNGIEFINGASGNQINGMMMNPGNPSWASGGTFGLVIDNLSFGNHLFRYTTSGGTTDFSLAAGATTTNYIQWCSVNSANGPYCTNGTWGTLGVDPMLFDTSAHTATVPLDATSGFAFKDTSGNNLIGENGAANTVTIGTSAQTVTSAGPLVAGPASGQGGTLTMPEGTTATAAAGKDVCYGDSTAHAMKCAYNNGSFFANTQTIASGQTALPTIAVGANACSASATTATATGAATTDAVTVTYSSDPTAVTGYGGGTSGGISIRTWATANTVSIKLCNETAGSITPGSLSVNWRITR